MFSTGALSVLFAVSGVFAAAATPDFRQHIQPILAEFCYDCHGDGMDKGGVAFDQFATDQAVLARRDLWLNALKNLRAGMMPPARKPQPSAAQKQQVEEWIKTVVFQLDPVNPDPGRATVRRLNRVEYRNTIRDLLGVDFDVQKEFPPDDTGHGFDNIADVLTLSPMLLEKYLAAAQEIVNRAVPMVPKVVAERKVPGQHFRRAEAGSAATDGPLVLSYYEAATATGTVEVAHAGRYQVVLDLTANERYVDGQFDLNKCRLVFRADGQELLRQDFNREGGKPFRFEFDQEWAAGPHELTFEVEPLTPEARQVRSLQLRVLSVTLRGPLAQEHWVRPEGYAKFFPKDPPRAAAQRREYARELLTDFAGRAFRRPLDQPTANRLAALAEATYTQPGKTFEAGVAQAMVAVLASPRFLFREEAAEPAPDGRTHPFVDEHSLASRLSYFLWSSMPDAELRRLAGEKSLRKNLAAQVRRMLADPRSQALMENFPGQWLQARDIESVPINARAVLAREPGAGRDPKVEAMRARFRELRGKDEAERTPEEKAEFARLEPEFRRSFQGGPRIDLTGDLRRAMRRETERTFEHLVREDRSLLELLDSDYTFLNEPLARHYGIEGVTGDELRLVKLPPGSPRGGVLTQGTVLAVTSNPTRTSPVKRGLFILENILGTPPPPPPPNIPSLEEAGQAVKDRRLSLRETLELHRGQPLCSSCHNRMDPLGLALENFNALGMWREQDQQQPVEVSGRLISGEPFADIRELKRILVAGHQTEFYHTVTEKLLTYALGRGLEYHDVGTVDAIVARLKQADGRFSALLAGIVESAPFQRRRHPDFSEATKPVTGPQQRADARIKP